MGIGDSEIWYQLRWQIFGSVIWFAIWISLFLTPIIRQFSRTKKRLKKNWYKEDYKVAYERGAARFYFFLGYSLLAYFWYKDWDEGNREFILSWVLGSTVLAIYCILRLLQAGKSLLSKRERFRISIFIILLIPTVHPIFFVLYYLETRLRKAKKMRRAHATWTTDKEIFLKEYKKASRHLEKKRREKSSQEVRVSDFLEANPDAVLYRAPINAREFEIICANWMQLWGEIDAVATQFSGDGGLDVVSSNFGAQVKFFANAPVGRPDVQSLYGAASGNGLQPAFFAYSSGYTDEALDWAKKVGMACFTFVPKGNNFEFEANTLEAAELALREEGWSYSDWQEWTELEEKLKTFQQEPPTYELPSWLRKKAVANSLQTTTIEISVGDE